jgi:hypothetical protein
MQTCTLAFSSGMKESSCSFWRAWRTKRDQGQGRGERAIERIKKATEGNVALFPLPAFSPFTTTTSFPLSLLQPLFLLILNLSPLPLTRSYRPPLTASSSSQIALSWANASTSRLEPMSEEVPSCAQASRPRLCTRLTRSAAARKATGEEEESARESERAREGGEESESESEGACVVSAGKATKRPSSSPPPPYSPAPPAGPSCSALPMALESCWLRMASAWRGLSAAMYSSTASSG